MAGTCQVRLPDGDKALHSCGQPEGHDMPHRCRGCDQSWLDDEVT